MLFSTELPWCCFMCRKEKFSECPGNPRRHFLELIRIFGERINARGPTVCPWDRGARPPPRGTRPCLMGPLRLHRPQLQLYIFTFGEKKIREKDSSRFMIRSCLQALISLERADLESIRGSEEGIHRHRHHQPSSITNFMMLTAVRE